MKIKPYINKLEKSKEYKDFMKKNEKAYLMLGYFVLDLEMGKNVHQLDFYIPGEKKVAAFNLDGDVRLQLLSARTEKVPEKLDISTNIDLDALNGLLEDEMKNRNITEQIKKIMAVLENKDGKKIWNLNCVLSGMGLLRAHVDDESKSVLKMEKLSMLDLIQSVPGNMLNKMNQNKNLTGDQAKEQLNKLNKIEEEIEKEKEGLQKQIKKDSKDIKEKPKSKE